MRMVPGAHLAAWASSPSYALPIRTRSTSAGAIENPQSAIPNPKSRSADNSRETRIARGAPSFPRTSRRFRQYKFVRWQIRLMKACH